MRVVELVMDARQAIRKITRRQYTAAKDDPLGGQLGTWVKEIDENNPEKLNSQLHSTDTLTAVKIQGMDHISNRIISKHGFLPVLALLVSNPTDLLDSSGVQPLKNPKLRQAVLSKTCGTGSTREAFPTIASSRKLSQNQTRASSCAASSFLKRKAKFKKPPGGRDNRQPSQPRKEGAVEDEVLRPFACPFFLFNREAHSRCLSKSLYRVPDIRMHIRRCHYLSYCPICFRTFENDPQFAQRDAHVAQGACHHVENPHACATSEQLEQMKTAARDQKRISNEERWYIIWDIMFPGRTRPDSPYIDVIAVTFNSQNSFVAELNQFVADGGVEDFLREFGMSNLITSPVLYIFLDYITRHRRARADVSGAGGQIPEMSDNPPRSTPPEMPELIPDPFISFDHASPYTDVIFSHLQLRARDAAGGATATVYEDSQGPPAQRGEGDFYDIDGNISFRNRLQ
ncbi:hypothetical protein F5Y16DRAFT_417002 [Xylariaceae sp. FL0255]|nr:hypothetical protein F5Y16DRAFT_417002 [Xylariaceae sp. FL0255]